MRFLILWGVCLALLSGCGGQPKPTQPESEGQPVMQLERVPLYESTATVPLTGTAPYAPWGFMEPDSVAADSAGDLLCDTLLPDGTEVVCYRDPEDEFVKYWAVRQGTSLLRFYEENSAYPDGYSAEPFTDILGQDGFRIMAPRGAAYQAYDYYTLDETGTPRLLAACANSVIEADVNGDGERELLWFYHGGRDIYYIFRQEGSPQEICLTDHLAQQEEPWLVIAEYTELTEDSCLPVRALQGGWETVSPETEFLSGRLRFTAESVHLEVEVPAS